MKAPPSSPVPPDRTCSDILSAEELPPASVKSMVSNVEKIIIDEPAGGSGVVPYLPLRELNKKSGGN